jgi:hypothetical protein
MKRGERDIRKIESKNSRRNMWKGKVMVELGGTSIWSKGEEVKGVNLSEISRGFGLSWNMKLI